METSLKNKVLDRMAALLIEQRNALLAANQYDLAHADTTDLALYDRLKIDDKKLEGMITALKDTIEKNDPVGIEKYRFTHAQGMEIINKTAPFGTILIIYESRPDVTIEAAALAFKAGSKILLKGGKEARSSNLFLISLWHQALKEHDLPIALISYLDYTREQTTELLQSSSTSIDLVVPRGGDALIDMVKKLSSAPVLVSGRGNNFIYVDAYGDLSKAKDIIINGKLHKISVCNATDKVLLHKLTPSSFIQDLIATFIALDCEMVTDSSYLSDTFQIPLDTSEQTKYEEFLAKKIWISISDDLNQAIQTINQYSGGHTAVIITEDKDRAHLFMDQIDAASVIHNASSRFTDGGQFGLGAELAISTDKLHHRGPLGLDHLVTNKWYVYGDGQVRK